LHITAIVLTWRALRRLKPIGTDKRRSMLFSALLLPAQAMRLRSLAGDGFFPVQHPLAAAVAFGAGRQEMERQAFNTLTDLRWPIVDEAHSPLAKEIMRWFRRALEAELKPLLRVAKIQPEAMLAPPIPDGAESCSYCPRCRDQFVSSRAICPNGVPLRPLRRH
jgi:hypothetical protein